MILEHLCTTGATQDASVGAGYDMEQIKNEMLSFAWLPQSSAAEISLERLRGAPQAEKNGTHGSPVRSLHSATIQRGSSTRKRALGFDSNEFTFWLAGLSANGVAADLSCN